MPSMRLLLLLPAVCLLAQNRPPAIENDQAKVLQVLEPPHQKTRIHEHKVNRVMVYLQSGRQDFEYEGGKKSVLEFKAGEAKWSPAGGMHAAEIVSATPVNIVEVEIKKSGDPSKVPDPTLDPLKVDPKHYKLEFENPQVRVTRVRIGPHESAPLHAHVLNRVVIYLTEQNTRIIPADGQPQNSQHKAGDVSWSPPAKHREENLNNTPFEAVVVEFKN